MNAEGHMTQTHAASVKHYVSHVIFIILHTVHVRDRSFVLLKIHSNSILNVVEFIKFLICLWWCLKKMSTAWSQNLITRLKSLSSAVFA